VIPLIVFTNDREKMGRFVNSTVLKIVVGIVAALILGLNVYLLWDTIFGRH
jgi:manganese transport protein